MIKTIATEGQRLDEIVVNYYGDILMFEEILELNPHLLDVLHLRAGDMVDLVENTSEIKTKKTEENLNALW